jgi:predicted metal-dependent HD superfamily phosphohydrolase
VRTLAHAPAELELAIWFHDAIYAPMRSDNEERSAQWASSSLVAAGVAHYVAERVADLIRATRHVEQPNTEDAQLLVDIDLAILGAGSERFAEYEEQIGQEYVWMPLEQFKQGRAEILQRFLARPHLFYSEPFIVRYEAKARANLARSLRRLKT